MLIIGICGASGSGKSTLARALSERIDRKCVYLKQDCYYFNHPDMTFEERCAINYDHPDAFDHDTLRDDLIRLRNGEPISVKEYDYTMHRRCDPGTMLLPADIVLVEGIHMFYDEAVRDQMDFRIYMQVDPDVCLLRRVKRDMRDRGRSIQSIYDQYLSTVKPMYEQYIRNYVKYADLIVAQGGKNARIVDMLAHYINSGLIDRLDR